MSISEINLLKMAIEQRLYESITVLLKDDSIKIISVIYQVY